MKKIVFSSISTIVVAMVLLGAGSSAQTASVTLCTENDPTVGGGCVGQILGQGGEILYIFSDGETPFASLVGINNNNYSDSIVGRIFGDFGFTLDPSSTGWELAGTSGPFT